MYTNGANSCYFFSLATGIPIDKVALLNQETRNYVGRKLLELTLKELFVFRFMQACSVFSAHMHTLIYRSLHV